MSTQNEKGLWDEQRYTGNGLSSGVLFALSWLLEVLSALGAGAVSKFEEHQQQGGRGRNVNLGAGTDASVGNAFDPRPILIVTGLAQEARIAAGPGMTVICSSSDPEQLRALLATFDPSTIRGIISFGVAGGLCPTLKSGDVVVATEIMAGDSRWLAGLALSEESDRRHQRSAAAGWSRAVWPASKKSSRLRPAKPRCIWRPARSRSIWRAISRRPMRLKQVCRSRRCAWSAIPRSRALPALAMAAIKPNGDIDLRKVLRGVARNPLTIAALMSTGLDFNRALRSLRGCRAFLLGGEGLVAVDAGEVPAIA